MKRHADEACGLQDVSFTYEGADKPALCEVSLSLKRGEMVAVMGATGAGKSTLAKCLTRIVPQFHSGTLAGEVWIGGRRLQTETVSDLAGTVGLVSQDFEAQLFATNVAQEVAFGMEQLGVPRQEMGPRLAESLELVGLKGFEGRDPTTLSGGEKQRLAIAATLVLQPQILIFDEPTTDLDPLGKLEIFAVLRKMRDRGTTLLVIEHETTAAEYADRLVIMAGGRIVAEAGAKTLLRDAAFLDAHGVRPPDLSRISVALGWKDPPSGFDEFATKLRSRVDVPTAATQSPAAAAATIVEIDAVSFDYETGKRALTDISLNVAAGEFVALIGQNGSGKTTLAKHMNGLLQPTQGRVRLRGRDLVGLRLNQIAAQVGYVFQNPDHQIFEATVFDEVAFAPRNLRLVKEEIGRRVAMSLEAVGLTGMEAKDPFLLGKGQRERLAVASLLALQPALLILDEPTTGLDYHEQRHMMQLIGQLHRQGMAIVMITHSPWVVAEYAARGILMRGGRVVFDGSLRTLFAQEALLEGAHFRVPDATRLGNRLGFTPLSVDELLAQVR